MGKGIYGKEDEGQKVKEVRGAMVYCASLMLLDAVAHFNSLAQHVFQSITNRKLDFYVQHVHIKVFFTSVPGN